MDCPVPIESERLARREVESCFGLRSPVPIESERPAIHPSFIPILLFCLHHYSGG